MASVPVFQIIVLRGGVQLVFVVISLLIMRRPVCTWFGESREQFILLCLRTAMGFGAVSFGFEKMRLLPLSEAAVLSAVSPVFTAVFAVCLLGERWHLSEFTSAVAAIVGVIFISMPGLFVGDVPVAEGSERAHALGIASGLVSCAFVALATVIVRILGTRVKVHFMLLLLFQSLGQMSLGLLTLQLVGERWVSLSWWHWFLALSMGSIGFLSQCMGTWGAQREKSALVSVVRQGIAPLCCFFWQLIFIPSQPILWTTVVGFVIIMAGLAVALHSMIAGLFGALHRGAGDAYVKLAGSQSSRCQV